MTWLERLAKWELISRWIGFGLFLVTLVAICGAFGVAFLLDWLRPKRRRASK